MCAIVPGAVAPAPHETVHSSGVVAWGMSSHFSSGSLFGRSADDSECIIAASEVCFESRRVTRNCGRGRSAQEIFGISFFLRGLLLVQADDPGAEKPNSYGTHFAPFAHFTRAGKGLPHAPAPISFTPPFIDFREQYVFCIHWPHV